VKAAQLDDLDVGVEPFREQLPRPVATGLQQRQQREQPRGGLQYTSQEDRS
jgi:hypothetical protein